MDPFATFLKLTGKIEATKTACKKKAAVVSH
jgi:hypothetical protein